MVDAFSTGQQETSLRRMRHAISAPPQSGLDSFEFLKKSSTSFLAVKHAGGFEHGVSLQAINSLH